MEKFLDLNPLVPRKSLFVDDSPTFEAYASAGFKNIGDDTADASQLQVPHLSPSLGSPEASESRRVALERAFDDARPRVCAATPSDGRPRRRPS